MGAIPLPPPAWAVAAGAWVVVVRVPRLAVGAEEGFADGENEAILKNLRWLRERIAGG